MNINPIDEAIANGEKPDLTKYDKRTLMASEYFQSVYERANAEQDAHESLDPKAQARAAESERMISAVITELHEAGYTSISSIDDIQKVPAARATGVEILARHLGDIDDPAVTWGMSLTLKNLKPKDGEPLVRTLKVLLDGTKPTKHLQAVFNLVKAIKSSKDARAIDETKTLLSSFDDPALKQLHSMLG